MSLDLNLLGNKITKYREQFQVSLEELAKATGIDIKTLSSFEDGNKKPSGDEILILADYFKCDYKFFISNERVAPFEQTELLFRRYGNEFSKTDRWAVQESLFLAECETFLMENLDKQATFSFKFHKKGTFFKNHAIEAANSLRQLLGYSDVQIPLDIYSDFRSIGLHVFRRKLENSKISGLCIGHPLAGKCILVNYNEDVYRQRFSTAHEAAHSILDDADLIVSFTTWSRSNLSEIRANTFASNYLMPPSFLRKIPHVKIWDTEKAIEWANKMKVSTEALAIALSEAKLIDGNTANLIKSVKVPSEAKKDPELPETLTPRVKERKKTLLEAGLSDFYVRLCFEGYHHEIISYSRLAEMLLKSETELNELFELYGEKIRHDI
jgi:Zn-dependent peptidase ImmA (M78 family)/DNA-binding XRE family transcriptional regulator